MNTIIRLTRHPLYTTIRVVSTCVFWLAVLLFYQSVPPALRWPVRGLWIFASGRLLFDLVSSLWRVKFTLKKTLFIAVIAGFNWLCLYLLCLVFNALMAQRDDRLTTRGMTSLPAECRKGIEALLAGKSMARYSREIGWEPRPGYKSKNYNVNSQGVRSTHEYPPTPADPAKRLLCMGDSFTFGTAVTNDETFPAQGEALLPGSEWLNFGMPATCLTQSYLRYLRDGPKFGGKHVIIGFMTNDAQRTVNCFRPFVNADSGAPLAKPFSKFDGTRFTLEPNPYSSLDDYQKLLANEGPELARLRRIDYLSWSGEMTAINPVSRTFAYVYEARNVEQNLEGLTHPRLPFNRWIKHLLPPDLYGRAIYDPRYKAFHAITALFERYHDQVVSDGREPFFVIFPGPLDVEAHQKHQTRQYAPLIEFLKAKRYAYLDFLDPLVAKHGSNLSYKALFVDNHYQGPINKEVAQEIIKAVMPGVGGQ